MMRRSIQPVDVIGFLLVAGLCALLVYSAVWVFQHGHSEETGNTVPATDTVMWIKSGDALIPIPVHYPAHPETRWVWDE